MRPIKPKPMPKKLEEWLRHVVAGEAAFQDFEHKDARAILAALEYWRNRANAADFRAHLAEHHREYKDSDGDSHAEHLQAQTEGLNDIIEKGGGYMLTPEFCRAQTEAVVPKPRLKKS